jgi:hypothetical protein
MKALLDILTVMVACVAAYLVYIVSEPAFRNLASFKLPKILVWCISILTLLAILELGRGVVMILLIPYAALGIGLVVLLLVNLFVRNGIPAPPQVIASCMRTLRTVGREYMNRAAALVRKTMGSQR